MIRINQLKLPINHSYEELVNKAVKTLKISEKQLQTLTIIRQSLDARKKPDLFYVYSVDCKVANEQKIFCKVNNKNIMLINERGYQFPKSGERKLSYRPIIIGLGPAGLFCGYMLAKAGYCPLILERGESVENRQQTVEQFWKNGILNPESNVQFGEGGAGTFSDGKLNTLVKDKYGRNHLVMNILAEFGAPKEITYQQKPHIGTDVLIHIVRNMRKEIEKLGGEVRFQSKVTDIRIENNHITAVTVNDLEEIPCEVAVLAPGHSARDTFRMLYDRGVSMQEKAFAVGVRMEHPQSMINLSQYGTEHVASLGAASYKLTYTAQNGRGIYSFCMCPGGYVVNASSEEQKIAINGMSYQKRDSANANIALIVTVTPKDYECYKKEDTPQPLCGVDFQRELEKKAFQAANGAIPVQLFADFKDNRMSSSFGEIKPCMKGNFEFADVRGVFPDFISETIIEGVTAFGKHIKGYDRDDAILSAVESRTSSPVRILRMDDTLESDISGFYPCGEGAGYAGGITSAAMDGIKVAEAIAKKYMKFR